LETPVTMVNGDGKRITGVCLADGAEREFDFVILAVPWGRVGPLLPPAIAAALDPLQQFAAIGAAPITSVHLWFDRPLTELPHAVLVGRLSQWVFARTPLTTHHSPLTTHYYQVVISASHDLAGRERQAIVDEVVADLHAVFPAAASAKLLRWQLLTERDAVFSVRPGLDKVRPRQQTVIPNLLLAGDWTCTGWPATMEGAVKSGFLAAEALLAHLGRQERIVVPELPRGWLLGRPATCPPADAAELPP
jgi:predicted NAD/FAD-dependent oxidoreductase